MFLCVFYMSTVIKSAWNGTANGCPHILMPKILLFLPGGSALANIFVGEGIFQWTAFAILAEDSLDPPDMCLGLGGGLDHH